MTDFAYIAVHSTRLGPALGGCRIWQYDTDDAALLDVLRLAKGMTYKNSLAGLNFGGGKCVVNAAQITRDLMLKIGKAIHHLGDSYISAEDVGTTVDAMRIAAEKTSYIECSDDPSPWTALGVYAGMLAAMRHTVLTLQKAGVG